MLYGSISEIDIQHKILSIAAAAKLFGSEQASLNIEIFLNEGDGENLYQVIDSSDKPSDSSPTSNSPYIMPLSYKTKKLHRTDANGYTLASWAS